MSQPEKRSKEPKTSSLKLNLSPSDHDRWARAARVANMPLNTYIRKATEELIAMDEARKKRREMLEAVQVEYFDTLRES